MNTDFDPRTTPARPDLAAWHLRTQVRAERYEHGTLRQVIASRAQLLREPRHQSTVETELLFGERFKVYEEKESWAWGQSEVDDYVGYIYFTQLGDIGPAPMHRIGVRGSHIYFARETKADVGHYLSLGSRLHVVSDIGRFCEVSVFQRTAYVPRVHLKLIDERASDFVAVAEQFMGAPYVWGGRTSLGLDCSALVQLCLAEAGFRAPRDSDQQRAALGTLIGGPEALGSIQRGDLIFWDGHVAIAIDQRRIVHANATAMAVSVDDAIPFAREVEASNGPVLAVKRLEV